MQWDDSLDLPRRTLAQLSNMHVALYRLANAVQSGTTALPTCKSGDTFDAGDCLYYRNGHKATVSRLVRCVKDGAPVLYLTVSQARSMDLPSRLRSTQAGPGLIVCLV